MKVYILIEVNEYDRDIIGVYPTRETAEGYLKKQKQLHPYADEFTIDEYDVDFRKTHRK